MIEILLVGIDRLDLTPAIRAVAHEAVRALSFPMLILVAASAIMGNSNKFNSLTHLA